MTDSLVDTKILVVDDDDSVRSMILRVIEHQGYTGFAAEDAGRALQILDQQEIDLVLLDLHMPGPADGEDLLFLLRDRSDEVPIIIVSGWVDDEATINQPDCVHAVLKKPVRIDELAETIRQVLALA
ncbi:MAG: response regulator [bacterium]|nr:response regulator [bacterium]